MSNIAQQLRAAVAMDAVNGDSMERGVVDRILSQAASEIESLERKLSVAKDAVCDVGRCELLRNAERMIDNG